MSDCGSTGGDDDGGGGSCGGSFGGVDDGGWDDDNDDGGNTSAEIVAQWDDNQLAQIGLLFPDTHGDRSFSDSSRLSIGHVSEPLEPHSGEENYPDTNLVRLDPTEDDDGRNFYDPGQGSTSDEERQISIGEAFIAIGQETNSSNDATRQRLHNPEDEVAFGRFRLCSSPPNEDSRLHGLWHSIHRLTIRAEQEQSSVPVAVTPCNAIQPCDSDDETFCGIINLRMNYRKLPLGKFVRVLFIYPKSFSGDIINCSLETISLDQPHVSFEALSYRWSGGRNGIIRVNHISVAIHHNLLHALQTLRLETKARVVWVDALCINQHDEKEKQSQISMMQRVYSSASRVVVYLGAQDMYSDGAFSAMSTLVTSWLKTQLSRLDTPLQQHPISKWYRTREGALILSKSQMRLIWHLFENEYWTRLWVVQEIVASSLAIVIQGADAIPWTMLGLAATLIRTNDVLWRKFISCKSRSRVVDEKSRRALMNTCLMHQLCQKDVQKDEASFLDMLRLTANFHVSMPLDRIYAVMGLPSQQSGPDKVFMQPNYALLKEGLYVRVCYQIIKTHGNSFEILSAVKHDNLISPNFATWIPQWHRQPIRSITSSYRDALKFNASAGLHNPEPPQIVWSLRNRSFNVDGIVIDGIGSSAHVLSQSNNLLGSLFTTRVDAQWIIERRPQSNAARAFAMALSAGQNWYGSILRSQHEIDIHVRTFLAWFKLRWGKVFPGDAGDESSPEDLARYHVAFNNVCADRKLFRTRGGLIGLGPAAMKTGDVVCVLFGGRVPYVLRKIRPGALDYYFVGECYMDGIMFGEAISQFNSGVLTSQNISLR